MDRYQLYAIEASVLFLAGWLIHLARRSGLHRPDLRRTHAGWPGPAR